MLEKAVERWAKRFYDENPLKPGQIGPREEELYLDTSLTYKVKNGAAIMGPSENWPAQLESIAITTSMFHGHGDSKITYNAVKIISGLHAPGLVNRGYVSNEEYLETIKSVFGAVKDGLLNGRLKHAIAKRENEIRGTFRGKFLSESKLRKKARESLPNAFANLLTKFEKSVPKDNLIRGYGIGEYK